MIVPLLAVVVVVQTVPIGGLAVQIVLLAPVAPIVSVLVVVIHWWVG